ncbi:hypothetical protein LPJ59_000331 [Coemansia sp. RSA 2399]|nr:hypothetical protein LPJ59_000331 [Coemansia sp. RSA 2399]KAJ1907853.1 hypothetical protein LPJ81_000502 [Coemansia sp. IMI 209127]
MSNSTNIMAIPQYPPLPRNVPGAFSSVEQRTYPSAQKSRKGSPIPAVPTSGAQSSAMAAQRQQSSPSRNPIRQHPYAASYEAQHPRYTGRVRSNSGHAPMMSSEMASEFPRANISNARSSIDPSSGRPFIGMRPSASFNKDTIPFPQSLPRRNSVTSHASSSASNESSYQMHHHRLHSSPNNASMDFPMVPSGPMRMRHDSISSNASMSSASGRNGDSQCGERKYVCDWHGCTQAFDRVEHLNRHMRRHTGEKPYCCLVARCSKLFSRFDNMMQHVGIHSLEGTKTEIPNIKNLSVRGNGRGRARRTSYRGAGDPHEKFRRHVEGALGTKLAVSCILPTDNPDFSNLTLRPLLNVDPDPVEATPTVPDQQQQQKQQQQQERKNSLSTLSTPPAKVSPALQQQILQIKRPRHDSVVDGMDNHHIVPSHSVVASSHSSSGRDYFQHQPVKDNQAPSQWLSHRNSLGLVPSMAQVSNLRGQPSHHNNA